jgi:ribose transport system permease protein
MKAGKLSLRGESLRYLVPYLLFVICWFVVATAVRGYGTLDHFLYIVQFAGFLGIVSAGQTLVIVAGGIDLSVGALITLSAVVTTQTMYANHLAFPAAALCGLLASLAFGVLSGVGVGSIKIPPLIMTLVSATIAKGAALLMTDGSPHEMRAQGFQDWVVKPGAFGINGILQTWIAVSVLVVFLMGSTSFGKKLQFLGSSPKATVYAGYNPKTLTVSVYAISALLSGATGILLIGFTGNSYLGMGDTYQLSTLAAVVMGGTSILGGSGSYAGTIAGALLLTLITSVLTLFSVSGGAQVAIEGAIILLLMIAYATATRVRD